MKNQITLFLLVFFLSIACNKDFDEINENPNAPENVAPQFLLANVISVSADRNTYDQGFRLSNYLAQFSASVEFERIDRYEMGTNSGYWSTLYQLLNDLESMKNSSMSNEAYKALADILRSYLFSQLTDLWGDVPYSEAVNAGNGIVQPSYDTQEFIYTDPENGILATLENAVSILKTTDQNIQGDVLYGGNKDQWIRFANSLRVRYYIRIGKRISDFSPLQTLVNTEIFMESNADNAVLPYLSAIPNQFPMSQAALGLYQEHRMTTTVDSILKLWNDPRIEVLYKPTQKSVQEGTPEFKGLQNGQNRETISDKGIDLNDISLFGSMFRDVPDGIDAQFMQYAELQFALAEAAERGWINGSASTYYEEGIRASFDYYNIDLPEGYLEQPEVNLNGTDHLNKILTQKWLSLNTNGHEAWFNIRRTGIPDLEPGPDNLNNDQYPVRYLYPESEQATNSQNNSEAAARIGGNTINSSGWWEAD